jgi:hypothetical protein
MRQSRSESTAPDSRIKRNQRREVTTGDNVRGPTMGTEMVVKERKDKLEE